MIGLARSDNAAKSLTAAKAEVQRGSLEDLESLRSAAAAADGVIHAAFIHDFNNYAAAAEADKRAIDTLGAALAGSDRRLIVTSGTLLAQRQGPIAVEDDPPNPNFPRKSEEAARALISGGVNVVIVRLPPSVHGAGDHGFVPTLINLAREKEFRRIPGTASTAGLPCTASTRRISTSSCLRRTPPEQLTTVLPTRACQPEISPK